ncbi:hypothetical protein LXA43DRAFT_180828 [Ganoderma leucocontextum]|nr:hypothetical protein LXA43DRAFT_180828 [Ganoderma leucocontextum]
MSCTWTQIACGAGRFVVFMLSIGIVGGSFAVNCAGRPSDERDTMHSSTTISSPPCDVADWRPVQFTSWTPILTGLTF